MNPARNLVFAFGPITSLRLQTILARRLARRGWRVTFLQSDPNPTALTQAKREIGTLGAVHSLDEFENGAGAEHKPSIVQQVLLKIAARTGNLRGFAPHRKRMQTELDASRTALRTLGATALIVSEDGYSCNFRVLAAAKQLGVPVVDVPYGFHSKSETDIDLARKKSAGELIVAVGIERRLLQILAPHWLRSDGPHKDALIFPPAYILAAATLGIRIPNPWTVHGGIADVLCVDSIVARRHYLEEGVDSQKMVMTGSPYADEMVDGLATNAEAMRAFRQPRWIGPKPRVLVSWLPDYHDQRGSECEFATYDEMTSQFFRGLKSDRYDVTVSLHPACPTRARGLVTAEGHGITSDSLIALIPQHDIYITYYSSTIRWAHASGKPVLNYDAYNLDIKQFDSPGFLSFTRFDGLRDKLIRMTSSETAYREVAEPQCRVAASWGETDGRACQRIESEIARLCGIQTDIIDTQHTIAQLQLFLER